MPPAGVENLPLEDQGKALLICRDADSASLRKCELRRQLCVQEWPK